MLQTQPFTIFDRGRKVILKKTLGTKVNKFHNFLILEVVKTIYNIFLRHKKLDVLGISAHKLGINFCSGFL